MAVDSEHAVAILSKIFENGTKSDMITLIAGVGGQRSPIHRVVLAANSEYSTLRPNFEETNENEFILDGTDGSTLKAIVDFCYTGRIDLTEENVLKYLAIASGVELFSLEQKCFCLLTGKLSRNNALTTLSIAEKFNGHVLRQKAFDLICQSFEKIPLPDIEEMDKRLLVEVLKSDTVHAEEQFILERVLSWFQKDQGERGQYMAELSELIRSPNSGTRRCRSIYCLFMQNVGINDEQQFTVKIERYIRALDEFEGIGEIELGQLRWVGATLHEYKVYIIGGEIDRVAQKSVSLFDLISGEKRVLPEMASARCGFASILVGKFIYVFGGSDATNTTYLASCERFDIEAESWQTLKPMSIARSFPAVTELNGYIYVAGGLNASVDSVFLQNVELFDPKNDEWITLAPMNGARCFFTFFTFKNALYAMGGTQSPSYSIEIYDGLTTRWTMNDSSESWKDIMSSVVVNDEILAIKKNGEFGEIKIEENGGCSFIAKSKLEIEYSGHQVLFCN